MRKKKVGRRTKGVYFGWKVAGIAGRDKSKGTTLAILRFSRWKVLAKGRAPSRRCHPVYRCVVGVGGAESQLSTEKREPNPNLSHKRDKATRDGGYTEREGIDDRERRRADKIRKRG